MITIQGLVSQGHCPLKSTKQVVVQMSITEEVNKNIGPPLNFQQLIVQHLL